MNDNQELVAVLAVCGVAALAAFINGYVLLVILLTKQTSSPINVLLTHLSAVDLMVCISALVSILPEMFNQHDQVAPWLCPFHGFLFTFLHPMAIWTVCGLNCDRYCAIAAPLHYGTLVNSRKIMLGLCGTWIVCLLISLPPVFRLVPFTYQPGLPVCTADFSKGRATIFYSVFYTTVTLVIPGVIILGCNIKVFTIARYHRHRIASAIFEVTLSAQVTITHQRNPFFLPTAMANKLRRSNAFSAVFQIVGSLAVFYLPHYAVCLYESLCAALGATPRTHRTVKTLSFALITGSALCNGLLYGIKNKLLKKTYQNYRRKMMTKCEVNQEIQARTPSACGSRRPSLTPVAVNHALGGGSANDGAGKVQTSAATTLLFRRSSHASLIEPGELRRHRGRGGPAAANGLNFGTYYCTTDGSDGGGGGGGSTIRRCYSSSTASDGRTTLAVAAGESGGCKLRGTAAAAEFVQKIRRDSRRSPRILITRAMSEENESCASEPGTPVRKDLVHKLSSSTVTLFIDERRKRERPRTGSDRDNNGSCYYDDDEDDEGGGGVDDDEDDDDDDDDEVGSNVVSADYSCCYSDVSSYSNDGCGADCETPPQEQLQRARPQPRFSSA